MTKLVKASKQPPPVEMPRIQVHISRISTTSVPGDFGHGWCGWSFWLPKKIWAQSSENARFYHRLSQHWHFALNYVYLTCLDQNKIRKVVSFQRPQTTFSNFFIIFHNSSSFHLIFLQFSLLFFRFFFFLRRCLVARRNDSCAPAVRPCPSAGRWGPPFCFKTCEKDRKSGENMGQRGISWEQLWKILCNHGKLPAYYQELFYRVYPLVN